MASAKLIQAKNALYTYRVEKTARPGRFAHSYVIMLRAI